LGPFARQKVSFSGALFGMNGTLFDTERWFRQAWWNILARRGLRHMEYDPEWHEGSADAGYFLVVMERFGIDEDEESFTKEWQQEADRLVLAHAQPCEGVRRTLKDLAKLGIPMGVVTGSSTPMAQALLMKHGIAQRFRFVVSRTSLEEARLRGKPAPDPYIVAAHILEMPTSRCIAFEDSVYGVISAKQAGCRTVIGTVNYPEEREGDVNRKRGLLHQYGADLSFVTLRWFRLRDYLPSL